jgi:hypothetical protein
MVLLTQKVESDFTNKTTLVDTMAQELQSLKLQIIQVCLICWLCCSWFSCMISHWVLYVSGLAQAVKWMATDGTARIWFLTGAGVLSLLSRSDWLCYPRSLLSSVSTGLYTGAKLPWIWKADLLPVSTAEVYTDWHEWRQVVHSHTHTHTHTYTHVRAHIYKIVSASHLK